MKSLRRNRLVSLATAIVAVLAALGTLFAHHRSVSALDAKNEAILAQGRAFDVYNAYDAKEIRFTIYQALVASDLVVNPKALARLKSTAAEERKTSPALLTESEALEARTKEAEARAQMLLKSYELMQFATTFFEIAIVLVSIAAMNGSRYFLSSGVALSAAGLVLFSVGLFAGH